MFSKIFAFFVASSSNSFAISIPRFPAPSLDEPKNLWVCFINCPPRRGFSSIKIASIPFSADSIAAAKPAGPAPTIAMLTSIFSFIGFLYGNDSGKSYLSPSTIIPSLTIVMHVLTFGVPFTVIKHDEHFPMPQKNPLARPFLLWLKTFIPFA